MKFTDIFIRRPVLACVVSLMLLVLGLKAFYSLPILEYPKTENAVVTITTVYYGADPETVAGFVTTPLENAIAQANGIDYMSSNSRSGVSTITANLVLNFDPDKAITEITAKINSVLNQLPAGVQQPTLTVAIGQSLDALIIGFASDDLSPNQITDYLIRNVQPRLQAVPGVQTAELLGGQNFALRAWLDPAKARRLRTDRHRCDHRTRRQQRDRRHRHHQGPDGAGQPDRLHQPALGAGVPQPRDQAGQRRHHPAERRRQRHPGLRRLRIRRRVQRQEGRLYRHPDRALRQPAGRRQRREGRCCRRSRSSCRPA